jgi:hypothetical protein
MPSAAAMAEFEKYDWIPIDRSPIVVVEALLLKTRK